MYMTEEEYKKGHRVRARVDLSSKPGKVYLIELKIGVVK